MLLSVCIWYPFLLCLNLSICVQSLVFQNINQTVSMYLLFSLCVQDAIRRLKPINPVSLSVSSRTDTGVHALSNSAHFDLQRRNNMTPFTEDSLVEALNFYLKSEQIRWVRNRWSKLEPISVQWPCSCLKPKDTPKQHNTTQINYSFS